MLLRNDRILGEKVKGRDVLLYIHNSLDAVVRVDLYSNCFEKCIWCDLTISNDNTLV